jgi:hypothetical protein
MGRVYGGVRRDDGGVLISVGKSLTDIHPLKQVVRHSPTGMEFGYGGSGPADLALSILTDVFGGRVELADLYYMEFKFEFVAGFGDTWTITEEQIDEWLRAKTGNGVEDLQKKFDALDEEGRLNVRYSREM